MRLMVLPVVAALSLTPWTAAQEDAAAPKPTTQSEFDVLFKEFEAARETFSAKLREVYEKDGINAYRRYLKDNDPTPSFIPRFQDGAAKYAPTPAAIPYLTWLLTADRSPENDTSRDALANLVVDHIESAELQDGLLMLEYGWRMTGKADADEAITEALDNSPHASVKAAALFARAMMVLNDRQASEDAKAPAIADLRKALAMAPNADFISRAEGVVFEQDHLQVGKTAPDINGRDLDGVDFALSDYKGKVVLLDFWGNW